MNLLDFHNSNKILFVSNLTHLILWPSADVKPMSKCLLHPMTSRESVESGWLNSHWIIKNLHSSQTRKLSSENRLVLYDNDYSSIIDMYFYEHLVLALNSLDTLSDVRIKAFMLLF
jgi:hypothetical protein